VLKLTILEKERKDFEVQKELYNEMAHRIAMVKKLKLSYKTKLANTRVNTLPCSISSRDAKTLKVEKLTWEFTLSTLLTLLEMYLIKMEERARP